jgi:pullulanase/glycogen debranching enzyme
MVSTCKEAGVQIIADTLFNHMAGSDSGEEMEIKPLLDEG